MEWSSFRLNFCWASIGRTRWFGRLEHVYNESQALVLTQMRAITIRVSSMTPLLTLVCGGNAPLCMVSLFGFNGRNGSAHSPNGTVIERLHYDQCTILMFVSAQYTRFTYIVNICTQIASTIHTSNAEPSLHSHAILVKFLPSDSLLYVHTHNHTHSPTRSLLLSLSIGPNFYRFSSYFLFGQFLRFSVKSRSNMLNRGNVLL